MATTCDFLIAQGIERDCLDPMVQGVEADGIIINRADIDFANVEFDEDNPNIISALPLLSGKVGYTVYQAGSQPFSGSAKTIEAPTATLDGMVTSAVAMKIPNNSPDVSANIIDKMLGGEFVVILKNKHKNLRSTSSGFSAYEIYGFYNGLRLSEGGRELYSDDTNGGWTVTLTETKAPKSALFLYAGSLSATDALVNTLLGNA